MSVILTLLFDGDPGKLEEYASGHRDELTGITERAKEQGLIAHRFYGAEGKIMVVDEWPDPESFQRFFQAEQGAIGPIMEAAEVTGEPQPTFWRKLDTGDEVGWE